MLRKINCILNSEYLWYSTVQDCLIPSAPINGTVEIVSGTVFESIANVSCADGFSLVGNTTIVCQADGTWSDLPMCLGMFYF